MSVKKILSAILAIAIMLTMASFPAFAEDAKIALTASNITNGAPSEENTVVKPTGVTATLTSSGKGADILDGNIKTPHQAKLDPGDGTTELVSYTFN